MYLLPWLFLFIAAFNLPGSCRLWAATGQKVLKYLTILEKDREFIYCMLNFLVMITRREARKRKRGRENLNLEGTQDWKKGPFQWCWLNIQSWQNLYFYPVVTFQLFLWYISMSHCISFIVKVFWSYIPKLNITNASDLNKILSIWMRKNSW